MRQARYILIIFFLTGVIHGTKGQSQFKQRLADSAYTLTRQQVVYDPAYFRLDYPNGDVPEGKGVCTDVIIRACKVSEKM